MGLIRKTLMLGTGGAVSGSSKKQRIAKAQLKEMRQQTRIAEQRAQAEHAAAQTPRAGWFPDQNQPGTLRYFDGQRWTNQTARID